MNKVLLPLFPACGLLFYDSSPFDIFRQLNILWRNILCHLAGLTHEQRERIPIGPLSLKHFLEQSQKQSEWIPYSTYNVATWEWTPSGKLRKESNLSQSVESRSFLKTSVTPTPNYFLLVVRSFLQASSSSLHKVFLFHFFFIIYPYVALNVVIKKEWLAG